MLSPLKQKRLKQQKNHPRQKRLLKQQKNHPRQKRLKQQKNHPRQKRLLKQQKNHLKTKNHLLKQQKNHLKHKKPSTKAAEKPSKTKKTTKAAEKPPKPKKLTKKELEEIKREEEKTLEEELEEQLTDNEIENFQIEKVDMERLTAKVCDILAEKESDGLFQSELWKKLKLTSRDGSRLALKLERMGTIYREKLLEKGRWTYKLILKKTPISTLSIENAPCLVCPVEQKCSLEGEISPKTCQLIEDWVIAEMKKPTKTK